MAWYAILQAIGGYLLDLFLQWLKAIFVVPFQNLDMLWILIPVWAAWFFTEFFQEKQGTKMGNAITNSVVVLWGSIDCARQTTYWMASHAREFLQIFLRYFLIGLIFTYGVIIIWFGLKGNKLIRFIARIREVTYVFAIFVPIFYNAIPISWNYILGAIVFFPIFYFMIELVDRYAPNPTAVLIDMGIMGEREKKYDSPPPMYQPPPAQPPIGMPPNSRVPPFRRP